MKFLKRERDWYFYFYSAFCSLIIFLLAMSTYGGIMVCLVMALINFFFLRITKFVYDLLAKLIGVVYERRK